MYICEQHATVEERKNKSNHLQTCTFELNITKIATKKLPSKAKQPKFT
jgi:hypothetical protein